MNCPLCNSVSSRSSWLGATEYRKKRFEYRECLECRSLYTSPMPNAEDLAEMYGPDYQRFLVTDLHHSGAFGIQNVLRSLEGDSGVFLDYACGAGALLKHVSETGWEAVGVEFDSQTAAKYSKMQGLTIVSDLSHLGDDFRADVVHLGDVLEHLTDINDQFCEILGRLRSKGLLIAQGPLEANSNMFFETVKLYRRLTRSISSDIPPYHVSLATADGQRKLFRRFGLEEVEFTVFENAHPAPESISINDLKNPRLIALYLLRKLSMIATTLTSREMGNRYFFVGRKS